MEFLVFKIFSYQILYFIPFFANPGGFQNVITEYIDAYYTMSSILSFDCKLVYLFSKYIKSLKNISNIMNQKVCCRNLSQIYTEVYPKSKYMEHLLNK